VGDFCIVPVATLSVQKTSVADALLSLQKTFVPVATLSVKRHLLKEVKESRMPLLGSGFFV